MYKWARKLTTWSQSATEILSSFDSTLTMGRWPELQKGDTNSRETKISMVGCGCEEIHRNFCDVHCHDPRAAGGKQGYLQQWGYLCTFPQPLCLEYKNIIVLRLRLCEKKFWLYNHFSPVMQDEYVSNRLLFEEDRFRHTPAALIDCVITFTAAW